MAVNLNFQISTYLNDVCSACNVEKKERKKKEWLKTQHGNFLTKNQSGSAYWWHTLKMCREKEMYFHNTYWQNHWRPQIGLSSNWFHEGIKRHWVIPLHCVGMCLVLLHYSGLCMEGFSFLRWQCLWLIGPRGISVCATAVFLVGLL